ncbi:MAG: molybdopterin cofactor-binding domain-containing protein [Pseudomonadota bacterium]
MSGVNLSRREFLRSSGVLGGGLVIGFGVTGCGSDPISPALEPLSNALTPNAFLQLTADNEFIFYCPRGEVGQGVTTALATLFGEELDVPPSHFVIREAGPHPDYGNPEFGGVQSVGGSTSVKAHYLPMRQVGADVRALILAAASKDLGIPAAELDTSDGFVSAAGEAYPYGRFIETAMNLPMPVDTPLTPSADFKYIGKSFPRVDALSKATGTAVYGIDVEVEGMEHAVVVRSPVARGSLLDFDETEALKAPGVRTVVRISNGVAVVADSFWHAKNAAPLIVANWDSPELAALDDVSLRAKYQNALDEVDGDSVHQYGELDTAWSETAQRISREYWAPYLAHAPLEPLNAIVHVKNNSAEVWAATQGPQLARRVVARTLDLEDSQVTFHSLQAGGSFGRRLVSSQVKEATEISRQTGTPIKLQWSREDDIRSGWFRPASLMRIEAGADEQGNLTAWIAKRVGGNAFAARFETALPGVLPKGVPDSVIDFVSGTAEWVFDGLRVDDTSIEGLGDDYVKAAQDIQHVTVADGLPLLFWRSVGHSYTAFAKESAIDELAHESAIDPVEFRLKNVGEDHRMRRVIEEAGEHYRSMQQDGASVGLAAHSSFHTRVAQVAAVSVEDGRIRVNRVVCVVDCGRAVNPDGVRAQMEGGIVFGLGAALYSNATLANGEIKESNFHDFQVARMGDAPDIEVIIIDSDEPPTGAGEPGVPPIAPAVANAIFAATGDRLRSLPLSTALRNSNVARASTDPSPGAVAERFA